MNIENVTKIYRTKDEEIVALDNVSFSFESGKFYAIMGHSGSGKSTLIRILGLIDNFDKGNYTINNKNVKKLNDDDLSMLRMKTIGFIFQDFYLDENLKAYENVILPMIINKEINNKERKNKAIMLLEKVGLSNRVKHFPRQMSGGEQQRVCIARALANNPNYILADEPTGNLDENNESLVFSELKKLSNSGKCVIVVSHSKNVEDYADVLLEIKNGKLVRR